jgi:predicted ATPase with chaperone activity
MHLHNGDDQAISKAHQRPIVDRIDIHLEVPRVPVQMLASLDSGEPSPSIHQRTESARTRQQARFTPLNKPILHEIGTWGQAKYRSSAS